jgi:hypothetical protein
MFADATMLNSNLQVDYEPVEMSARHMACCAHGGSGNQLAPTASLLLVAW